MNFRSFLGSHFQCNKYKIRQSSMQKVLTNATSRIHLLASGNTKDKREKPPTCILAFVYIHQILMNNYNRQVQRFSMGTALHVQVCGGPNQDLTGYNIQMLRASSLCLNLSSEAKLIRESGTPFHSIITNLYIHAHFILKTV